MTAKAARFVFWALLLGLPAAAGGTGHAQGLGLGTKGSKPIEVYANQGIEWNQTEKRYIARGNAKAIQGDTTVYADTLTAHYVETQEKGSEITRIDAVGNVKIVSPQQTVYGDRGVYDARKGVLVLTGKALKLVTKDDVVTARDSLEYYDEKSLAVARGNAVLRQRNPPKGKERTVRADVLTTQSTPKDKGGAKGGSKSAGSDDGPRRMDAYGNVVITRPGEIALGDRGVYRPNEDIAELWGKVRITRGKNQMNGERAIVNFKTGVSRLIAGQGGKGQPPVRVLIVPNQ
jgi:lipopolysaccharide export system protein LptA